MTTIIQYELVNPDTELEHEYDASPCPFCGSERVEFVRQPYHALPLYSVQCVTCDARGPACREYAQAVERWNAAGRGNTALVDTDGPAELLTQLAHAAELIGILSHDGGMSQRLMVDGGKAWRKWKGLPEPDAELCACPVPGYWPSRPETCPTCNRAHRERGRKGKVT